MTARLPPDHERVLDAETMLVLDRARALCGLHAGPLSECLPPDVERQAAEAFARVTYRIENRFEGKPAFSADAAAEYHAEREHPPPASNREEAIENIRRVGKARFVRRTRLRPAPNVTLDAIMWAVRDGGLDALNRPDNQVRIRSLTPKQRTELNARIEKWKASHAA